MFVKKLPKLVDIRILVNLIYEKCISSNKVIMGGRYLQRDISQKEMNFQVITGSSPLFDLRVH